jgi:hypothetical protein
MELVLYNYFLEGKKAALHWLVIIDPALHLNVVPKTVNVLFMLVSFSKPTPTHASAWVTKTSPVPQIRLPTSPLSALG